MQKGTVKWFNPTKGYGFMPGLPANGCYPVAPRFLTRGLFVFGAGLDNFCCESLILSLRKPIFLLRKPIFGAAFFPGRSLPGRFALAGTL